MTLVAAMDFGQYMLFGTDSQGEQLGLTQEVRKIEYIDTPAVAWAYSGEREVGEAFTAWVRGYGWDSQSSWDQFREHAKAELNRLNKAKRDSIRSSGASETEDDTAKVLVAGYIAGQPQILEITERGESYFHRERGFAAIGSGGNHALIVKGTLEAYWETVYRKPFAFSNGDFIFIVVAAAQMAPQCAPPPQICMITPSGIMQAQAAPSNSTHGQSSAPPSQG